MSIPYEYEIISVDEQARAMEVVYTSAGRQTMHIGARLPYVGESLEGVVGMYAPVAYWLEQEAQVQVPVTGLKGAVTPMAAQADTRSDLQKAKDDKLAELAAWRYEQEVGGIVIAGTTIKTDRESQATITGAYLSLSQGLISEVDWKAEGGVWVKLTLAQMAPIAQAVVAHVQACFSTEAQLAAEVAACTTVEQVEAVEPPAEVISGAA